MLGGAPESGGNVFFFISLKWQFSMLTLLRGHTGIKDHLLRGHAKEIFSVSDWSWQSSWLGTIMAESIVDVTPSQSNMYDWTCNKVTGRNLFITGDSVVCSEQERHRWWTGTSTGEGQIMCALWAMYVHLCTHSNDCLDCTTLLWNTGTDSELWGVKLLYWLFCSVYVSCFCACIPTGLGTSGWALIRVALWPGCHGNLWTTFSKFAYSKDVV